MCIVFDHVTGKPKQTYTAHTFAVRSVAHIPGTDYILSASSDKTVHQWNIVTGETSMVYKGHTDVLQSLCMIDAQHFATSSNDCKVFIWKVGKQTPLRRLEGHSSLVYTVVWNSVTSELITASEDTTVKVWGGASDHALETFDMVQSIHVPTVVWTVAALPGSGDIACGGADCILRIFTRDTARAASAAKQKALRDSVASQVVDVKVAQPAVVGGMDVSKMPSVEQLHMHQGTKEGERLFVRTEAGAVELHVWTDGKWEKVGMVVAEPSGQAVDGGRPKKLYNGVAYDYVFDVDLQGTSLKLPYNVGQDVLEAAKNFINENGRYGVTVDSHDQIVNFILQSITPEEVKKVPGLANAVVADGKVTTGPTEMPAIPWKEPEVFANFNSEGAQRKIRELTNDSEEFTDVIRSVGECDEAPLLCAQLLSLHEALPAGSRFPALDCIRYFAVSPRLSLHTRVELVHGALAALEEVLHANPPASDPEQLVTARLVANCAAVLYEGYVASVAVVIAAADDDAFDLSTPLPDRSANFLQWLVKDALQAKWSEAADGPLAKALAALAQNTAMLLSSSPPQGRVLPYGVLAPFSATLVTNIATLMTAQPPQSSILPSLLRTLLTLLNNSNQNNTTSCEAALKEARKSVLTRVKQMANKDFNELASAIVDILE
ncbi:phospholipase A-2-activating protein [Angomonas deanei]|nr:phospholipase A-2-activating protein [Angomonas deanei]|eukprot:EPY43425.1 phospholipase A-2-activating protein [Angomonas deanei]